MDVRVGLQRKLSAEELMLLLEKTLESPLDCKEIQPVNPTGNQSWILIGRIGAEAETPILWPPDAKNWVIGKDPDAGKDWRLEKAGWQRVRWLDVHRLNGHEFEPTQGDSETQGGLAYCTPWSQSQTRLCNWTTAQQNFGLWAAYIPHPGGCKCLIADSRGMKSQIWSVWCVQRLSARFWATSPDNLWCYNKVPNLSESQLPDL